MHITELVFTGKQFLKTNSSHVSALEGSSPSSSFFFLGKISWNEILWLSIEYSLSFKKCVYLVIYVFTFIPEMLGNVLLSPDEATLSIIYRNIL